MFHSTPTSPRLELIYARCAFPVWDGLPWFSKADWQSILLSASFTTDLAFAENWLD